MVLKTLYLIRKNILALGGESEGVFAVLKNGAVFLSENFGDLLQEDNFQKFKKAVLEYLQKNKIKPSIILTDLHPLYKTTIWGKELAKKIRAEHIQVQHHIAHIFSVLGENIINYKLHNAFGIACDGTGYGFDGKIWGGEIFKISNFKFQISNLQIKRIGHLENQIMIGGDLAVREPARMLIAILAKCKSQNAKCKMTMQNAKINKKLIYQFIKRYYTKNQFEVLFNQLQQNFNCLETSSAGRVLDAVSILLGFCGNQRNYKHEPIDLLEKNSTIPYKNIEPKIKICNLQSAICNLLTTPLFEYLIKNLHRDKKRLAATAQLYIAKGIYRIIFNFQFSIFKKNQKSTTAHFQWAGLPSPALWKKGGAVAKIKIQNKSPVYFAGGMANNKIISNYLESKDVYINKKISRGDAGLSFGQIIYYVYYKFLK